VGTACVTSPWRTRKFQALAKYRMFKKITVQWYSKYYGLASVMKTFTLKSEQTVHRSTPEDG
jgi:hypothetical protein